jgi:hypothetical protein
MLCCQRQKGAPVIQTRQVIGKGKRLKLPVQEGLSNRAQDGALEGAADRLSFRRVCLKILQEFIYFTDDACELLVLNQKRR